MSNISSDRVSPKLMPSRSQFRMTNKFGNMAKQEKKKERGGGGIPRKKEP